MRVRVCCVGVLSVPRLLPIFITTTGPQVVASGSQEHTSVVEKRGRGTEERGTEEGRRWYGGQLIGRGGKGF
jgi:hypothetical protein